MEDHQTVRRIDSGTALIKTAEKAVRARYGEQGANGSPR